MPSSDEKVRVLHQKSISLYISYAGPRKKCWSPYLICINCLRRIWLFVQLYCKRKWADFLLMLNLISFTAGKSSIKILSVMLTEFLDLYNYRTCNPPNFAGNASNLIDCAHRWKELFFRCGYFCKSFFISRYKTRYM